MDIKYDIKISDLKIDKKKILENSAGILINFKDPELLDRKIEKVKYSYLHMLEPSGVIREIDVSLFGEIFEESLPHESPVYKSMRWWREAAIFIITIGAAADISVKSLEQQGKIEEAFFLDLCYSVIVEDLADRIQKEWGYKKMHQGLSTARYSPGYCQWNVSGQEALFGFMAGIETPVSLLEGYKIFPRKSLTGVMAVEETDPNSEAVAACRECGRECVYMRNYISGD